MIKITVVTVSYNAESTIVDTIQSVSSQTYECIEYIIIDGGSTDGTCSLIHENIQSVDKFVSEPDRGIYDAMNKGIRLATGEIIAFINADDFYASDNVLEKVVNAFKDPKIDAVYGDLCYVNRSKPSKVVRYWKSRKFVSSSFEKGWCPPHPTFVVRKDIYNRYGGFDLRYKLAADADLMIRFLEVHKLSVKYVSDVLVNMRLGGATNRSIRNVIKQNREILAALREHGLKTSVILFVGHKFFSKSIQFFSRSFEAGRKG